MASKSAVNVGWVVLFGMLCSCGEQTTQNQQDQWLAHACDVGAKLRYVSFTGDSSGTITPQGDTVEEEILSARNDTVFIRETTLSSVNYTGDTVVTFGLPMHDGCIYPYLYPDGSRLFSLGICGDTTCFPLPNAQNVHFSGWFPVELGRLDTLQIKNVRGMISTISGHSLQAETVVDSRGTFVDGPGYIVSFSAAGVLVRVSNWAPMFPHRSNGWELVSVEHP